MTLQIIKHLAREALPTVGFIVEELGDLYGLRTWIEYGFRQGKQELGWKDYRFTQFREIEKWWEIILSAYLMIVLNSDLGIEKANRSTAESPPEAQEKKPSTVPQQWSFQGGFKKTLLNLRLIIQPTMMLWLISPRVRNFPEFKSVPRIARINRSSRELL